jgi:hypothetical protein
MIYYIPFNKSPRLALEAESRSGWINRGRMMNVDEEESQSSKTFEAELKAVRELWESDKKSAEKKEKTKLEQPSGKQ